MEQIMKPVKPIAVPDSPKRKNRLASAALVLGLMGCSAVGFGQEARGPAEAAQAWTEFKAKRQPIVQEIIKNTECVVGTNLVRMKLRNGTMANVSEITADDGLLVKITTDTPSIKGTVKVTATAELGNDKISATDTKPVIDTKPVCDNPDTKQQATKTDVIFLVILQAIGNFMISSQIIDKFYKLKDMAGKSTENKGETAEKVDKA